eukprot:COSAG02_NODE_1_length_108762_cov_456.708287_39_plen_229_part_00
MSVLADAGGCGDPALCTLLCTTCPQVSGASRHRQPRTSSQPHRRSPNPPRTGSTNSCWMASLAQCLLVQQFRHLPGRCPGIRCSGAFGGVVKEFLATCSWFDWSSAQALHCTGPGFRPSARAWLHAWCVVGSVHPAGLPALNDSASNPGIESETYKLQLLSYRYDFLSSQFPNREMSSSSRNSVLEYLKVGSSEYRIPECHHFRVFLTFAHRLGWIRLDHGELTEKYR